MKDILSQTISLAAIYQSCYIVKKVAWHGEFDENHLTILINSLFINNPTSMNDIYTDTKKLSVGLNSLKNQLTGINKDHEIYNYFSSLLNLSRSLEKNVKVITNIQEGLSLLKDSFSNNQINIDDKSTKIANLYMSTLSKIEPRIIVSGDNKYLKNPMIASKIRTSLFTGLRSVFLWKEFGGSKIKNFFFKSKILLEINRILAV